MFQQAHRRLPKPILEITLSAKLATKIRIKAAALLSKNVTNAMIPLHGLSAHDPISITTRKPNLRKSRALTLRSHANNATPIKPGHRSRWNVQVVTKIHTMENSEKHVKIVITPNHGRLRCKRGALQFRANCPREQKLEASVQPSKFLPDLTMVKQNFLLPVFIRLLPAKVATVP